MGFVGIHYVIKRGLNDYLPAALIASSRLPTGSAAMARIVPLMQCQRCRFLIEIMKSASKMSAFIPSWMTELVNILLSNVYPMFGRQYE